MQRRQLQTGIIALALLLSLHLVDLLRADTWVLGEGDLDPIAGGRCLCQENLRLIELATRQWMLDEHKPLDAVPTWDDLAGPGRPLATAPGCPSGGVYTLASPAGFPSCSLAGTWPLSHVYTDTPCTAPDDERAREVICRENLESINRAKQKWANDHRLPTSALPSWNDLVGTAKYLKSTPACPSGGAYELGKVVSYPTCSLEKNPGNPNAPDKGHSVYDYAPAGTGIDAERRQCQENLRRIDDARMLWAWQINFPDYGSPPFTELIGMYQFLRVTPRCSSGGTYDTGSMLRLPACSLTSSHPHDHEFSTQMFGLDPMEARCACQENLREIHAATRRWMVDHRGVPDDIPTWDDLVGPQKFLRASPTCPAGGVYALASAWDLPSCSLKDAGDQPHVFSDQAALAADDGTEWDRRCQCQENLRRIEDAKQSLQKARDLPADYTPLWEDLVGADLYLPEQPACPAGGVYSIGTIAGLPTCTLSGVAPYDHGYSHEKCASVDETVRALEITRRNECQLSQHLLVEAVARWRTNTSSPDTTTPNWGDLIGSGTYIKLMPVCPSGGSYDLTQLASPMAEYPMLCSLANMADFPHMFPPTDLRIMLEGEPSERLRIAHCRRNLLRIDQAKQRWGAMNNKPPTSVPTWNELVEVGLEDFLICPSSGGYEIGPLGAPPTCSIGTRSYFPHTINSSEGGYFAARNATRTIERLRRDDCVANLLVYKEATTRWAADTSAAPDAVPTLADLMPYIRYERLCPTGGVYTLAPPGTDPTCSRQDLALFPHVLESGGR